MRVMTSRLLFFLLLKALFVIGIILYAGIGLGPDEAQYWTWSQALDWGYYSKPPGIAWQIWLGTHLFGQTEWGVRSVTVILSILQALSVYHLALYTGLFARTAFWCGLFMAFCPLGMLGSFFAITDVGFLLCWTGACLSVVAALHQERDPNPLSIGMWIMAGALFKWPIYLFWIFVLVCRPFLYPKLKLTSLLTGIFISLIGLLPSIWWNWSHDWVTFRHVFATLQGGSGHRAGGNVGEFLASQAILLSPILFVLLLSALWQWFRRRKELTPALYFCGFVSFASLSIAIVVSCFQKIQGNWITLAYPSALIILGWDTFQQHPTRAWWAKIGVALSLLLILLFAFLPSFYLVPNLAPYAAGYRLHSFKHNIGWNALTEVLIKGGYNPKKDFLFSDKYQTVSILSFYGPGQKLAYFLNLQGSRNNQFSYWPTLQQERRGQVGYFVWVENAPRLEKNWEAKAEYYQEELQKYFTKVELVKFAPLIYEGDDIVKAALIFRCQCCTDLRPTESTLY